MLRPLLPTGLQHEGPRTLSPQEELLSWPGPWPFYSCQWLASSLWLVDGRTNAPLVASVWRW